jgi:hypothetical protein
VDLDKQIGQKNLALGVKFKAKAVVEVSEEAAQELPNGTLRDLHFETVEGDFQFSKAPGECIRYLSLSLSIIPSGDEPHCKTNPSHIC